MESRSCVKEKRGVTYCVRGIDCEKEIGLNRREGIREDIAMVSEEMAMVYKEIAVVGEEMAIVGEEMAMVGED